MGGSVSHSGVVAGGEQVRPAKRTGPLVLTGVVLAALSAITALVLRSLPSVLVSSETMAVVAVSSVLLILLCMALAIGRQRADYPKAAGLVIAWFLVSSEAFFMRWTSGETLLEGRFAFGAYAEGAMWVIAFVAVLIVTLGSPQYLRGMFRGTYKWLTMYGLLCLVSTPLSPQPSFSLAWAFKLFVVILVIQLYAAHVSDASDVAAFLRALLWASAFLSVAPILTAFFDPAGVFEGGRLGGYVAWDVQSAEAGTLLLLAMTLYSSGRRRAPVVCGIIGGVVMIVSGGKAGILACVISALLFFVLQKRVASALGFIAALMSFGYLIVRFTPLGDYLSTYWASGQASTLTGRTDVWLSALPAIARSPLFGHGFMASKFVYASADVAWQVGHLHNGVLEVLYNNGAVGLVLILAILGITLKNLLRVIRHASPDPSIRWMATGCLAIYANILINALVAPSFGGRVNAIFITLLALVGISDWLVRANDREEALSKVSALEP